MKKLLSILILSVSLQLFAQSGGVTLTDHSQIQELSTFRLMGVYELRNQCSKSASVKYRTVNHEGGMKVRVLEVLESDWVNGKEGRWLWVLSTAGMWVESGEWLPKHSKFLIFLPDDVPVFYFEK